MSYRITNYHFRVVKINAKLGPRHLLNLTSYRRTIYSNPLSICLFCNFVQSMCFDLVNEKGEMTSFSNSPNTTGILWVPILSLCSTT